MLRTAVGACLFLCACQGAAQQAPPESLEDCGKNQAQCGAEPMFVFTKLDLVQPDAHGRVAGFNLDGLASDGAGDDDCHVADFVSPEAVGGVDNRLSDLLANTTTQIKESVPAFVQNAIKSGGLLLIGEFVGADDFVNDDDVGLVFRRSTDVPLLGTDQRLLDGQTFSLAFDHYVGAVAHGKIVDGRFLAGPFELRLRIQVFGVRISARLRNVHADLQLNERGEVVAGLLGGTFHTDDVYGIADAMEAFDPNESTIPIIRALVPPLADVKSADSGKCDQISFALQTAAVRAFVFDTNPTGARYRSSTGEQLFAGHGCIDCHAVAAIPDARNTVGPSLDGLGKRAANRESPGNYLRQALVNPNGYVVNGYEPGIMPKNTRDLLTSYEFDTLVAWLSQR